MSRIDKKDSGIFRRGSRHLRAKLQTYLDTLSRSRELVEASADAAATPTEMVFWAVLEDDLGALIDECTMYLSGRWKLGSIDIESFASRSVTVLEEVLDSLKKHGSVHLPEHMSTAVHRLDSLHG